MTTYKMYQKVGRSFQYEKIAEYDFQVEPQAGDTVALGRYWNNTWIVDRRHWNHDGSIVLIVHRFNRDVRG